MGQRFFKVQRAVHAVALDGLAADNGAALAGERAGEDIRDLVERGRSRNELEDGSGRIGGMQEAVDIHALIGLGIALHIRHIVRIVGWGGDGAENFARLVVIDADGSLAAVQRGQRRALHVCAYGQHHPALALAGGIGAVDAVESDKLRTVFLQQERRDIALTVAEQVQHAAAQRGTVGIGLAVRGIEHDGAAAVDDLAAVHNAVRIDMGAVLERDPVRRIDEVTHHDHAHAEQKHTRQRKCEPRAFCKLIQAAPPPLPLRCGPRSWHSGVCPPP